MNEETQQLEQSPIAENPHLYDVNYSLSIPATFAESIAQIKIFALHKFDQEIEQKQLYYHTREHVENVLRRTNRIFQAVYSDEAVDSDLNQSNVVLSRTKLLLDLCAIAHDMVQIFTPQTQTHTARKREAGVSEQATIEQLLAYINTLNQRLQAHQVDSTAQLSDGEVETVRAAIAATICAYDPIEQAIYQPDLDDTSAPLPAVARILALADIGALGMDGIQAYHQEGSLLFLEENLDLIPLLQEGTIDCLATDDPALYENIRQRLLKRCRFQVSFAKSRVKRFRQEILGFPEEAIAALTDDVFQHLTPMTINRITTLTPTDEETPLKELLEFFQFEQYLQRSGKD
jgi:hypothetical protein